MHRDRKSARFAEAVAPLLGRRRLQRPGEDAIGAYNLIAARLGVGHKVAQEQRLGPDLKPSA